MMPAVSCRLTDRAPEMLENDVQGLHGYLLVVLCIRNLQATNDIASAVRRFCSLHYDASRLEIAQGGTFLGDTHTPVPGGADLVPGGADAHADCRALTDVLARIGDKWTVMVVGVLSQRADALQPDTRRPSMAFRSAC